MPYKQCIYCCTYGTLCSLPVMLVDRSGLEVLEEIGTTVVGTTVVGTTVVVLELVILPSAVSLKTKNRYPSLYSVSMPSRAR